MKTTIDKNDAAHTSENNISRVLAALRDTQAPLGMERRILQAAQNQASSPSRGRPLWQWSVGAFATAAILLALSLTAHKMTWHRQDSAQTESKFIPPEQIANSSVGPYPVTNSSVGSYPAPKARSIPAWGAAPGSDPEQGQWAENPTHLTSRRPSIADQETTAVPQPLSPSDAIALSEMQAPSQPAPPMPLTEQEKLLLRIVNRTSTIDLAQLDPFVREARNDEDKAEFQKFFAPPPELPQEISSDNRSK